MHSEISVFLGEHPRNWICIRDVALRHLTDLREQLEYATHCKTIRVKGPLARPITSTPKSQFKKSFVAEGSSPPSPVLHSSLICGNGVSPNSSDPSNTSLIHSRSPTSISELYEGKKSFFLPPSLKPRGPSIDLIKINSKLIFSAHFTYYVLCCNGFVKVGRN